MYLAFFTMIFVIVLVLYRHELGNSLAQSMWDKKSLILDDSIQINEVVI